MPNHPPTYNRTHTHACAHTRLPRGPGGTAFVLESSLWLLPISRAEETDLKCDDTMVFPSHRPARPQNHKSQLLRSHQSADTGPRQRAHACTHTHTHLCNYASGTQTLEVQRCTKALLIKPCYKRSYPQTGEINEQIITEYTAFKTIYHIY